MIKNLGGQNNLSPCLSRVHEFAQKSVFYCEYVIIFDKSQFSPKKIWGGD